MLKYFPVFLILPAIAGYRIAHSVNWRFLAGYLLAISLITYLLYALDKRRAKTGGWRTPEATLHLLEAMGGWIAAFLAQQQFRHKTSKRPFLRMYWLIVAVHQYLALELAFGWPILNTIQRLLSPA
ncbi:DUF1294 domain-containing protein [Coraliomargarita parva]|uniref:DUF1294 domain-containing protein n=1 Tax=Coraliomargarita parva TaxID=3014050 RepID=UPI0022B3E083|nr:DUF1294 domain-containing protein [Coraliomargarita parva]